MLDPHDRTSLFEALRPPPGFVLDAAVGTSFTLDLEALLTAPIAFALYESSQADPDDGEVEPVGLLEAIRRHAERVTLFCQSGQIAVPAKRRAVFAWLEDGVVEVEAPRPNRLFHPKVWLARYRAPGGTARLRALCATRNLTFDTSWDTLLRLESERYDPGDGGAGGQVGQTGLAAMFRRLPELARRPLAAGRAEAVAALADDLEVVPLVPPEPFQRAAFHVLGLDGRGAWPFPERRARALVVAPFLGERTVARFAREHDVAALVSREESLDRVPRAVLERIERLAVLNPAIDVAAAGQAERGDPGRPFAGLHAKLFLFDTADGARLFTGSANATSAAFDGNVEVLAELHGPPEVGAGAALEGTPGEATFADLLVDYEPLDEPAEPDEAEDLAVRLDALRQQVAATAFAASVARAGDDFTLRVRSERAIPGGGAGDLEVRLWPVTLDEASSAQPLSPGEKASATFAVTLEGITSFLALRLTAHDGEARASCTFLVNARLTGAPPDRHSRLLAAMLRDPDRLLRYLLMLLHDPGALADGERDGMPAGAWAHWFGAGWDELPLLELLLRAVDRHPDRLDHIDRLLHDLAGERAGLLPEGWEAVWEPIWRYRRAGRS